MEIFASVLISWHPHAGSWEFGHGLGPRRSTAGSERLASTPLALVFVPSRCLPVLSGDTCTSDLCRLGEAIERQIESQVGMTFQLILKHHAWPISLAITLGTFDLAIFSLNPFPMQEYRRSSDFVPSVMAPMSALALHETEQAFPDAKRALPINAKLLHAQKVLPGSNSWP